MRWHIIPNHHVSWTQLRSEKMPDVDNHFRPVKGQQPLVQGRGLLTVLDGGLNLGPGPKARILLQTPRLPGLLHLLITAGGSVAKNGRFMAKTGRLPRPSHTGSLLWPNPIHSNGVITRAKSSFSACAGICVMLSAIVTSKK